MEGGRLCISGMESMLAMGADLDELGISFEGRRSANLLSRRRVLGSTVMNRRQRCSGEEDGSECVEDLYFCHSRVYLVNYVPPDMNV